MKKLQGLFSLLLALAMTVSLGTSALAAAYPDVSDDDWYAEAANELRDKGIMTGMDGGFNAGGTFTRAQLATVLYRMAGSPAVTGEDSFTDRRRRLVRERGDMGGAEQGRERHRQRTVRPGACHHTGTAGHDALP